VSVSFFIACISNRIVHLLWATVSVFICLVVQSDCKH